VGFQNKMIKTLGEASAGIIIFSAQFKGFHEEFLNFFMLYCQPFIICPVPKFQVTINLSLVCCCG